jgi:tetratricopeptide (TPR) repeat protein
VLFDLRGRGRRRTVQGIYLGLAILMGGGLVLFGVGGNVSGGLLDALKENKSSSGTDVFEKRLKAAEKLVVAQPQNAQAWANVVKLRFQVAGTGDSYDDATGAFTEKGKLELQRVDQAWDRYLALDPKKIDTTAANYMVQAYSPGALNKADKLVRAYEVVIEGTPKPTYDQYRNLAIYSYVAGQTRKGDLAREKALELAPKDQRSVVKQQIDAQKSEAIKQQIQSGGADIQPSG